MKKFTFAALAVPLMWVLPIITTQNVYAQEHTMTLVGKVQDANGPLEGVTVWQVETNNATLTDDKGYYTLEVIKGSDVQFEIIGYKTQTYQAVGNIRNVTLVADEEILDEIVINAGYYTVKDKERTGSISKITAKEIGQQPVANPLAAMQGRMAGVNITQSSGTPGGGFDIQIRGRNSLRTEGNAPLYIVDGVPYPSQSMSNSSISGGILAGNVSPLNSINPNSIESIEVLKDADATAIYGSRGANGVVLITTKKNSSKETKVSIQSSIAIATVPKFMKLMSTEEYLKMRRDGFLSDGLTELPSNAYDVNGTWDQNRYTNWQKEFIGGQAVTQLISTSVSGGNENTSYMISANDRKESTIFPGDFGYKRTNYLATINHNPLGRKLSLQSTIQMSNQRNNLMANDLTSSIFLAPNAPSLWDQEGNLNWENNTFDNPLSKIQATYTSKTFDVLAQVHLKYALSDHIKLAIHSGMNTNDYEEVKATPHTIYNPAYGLTSEMSSVMVSTSKRNQWIVEPTFQADWGSDKNQWNGIVGATFENRTLHSLGIQATNFSSNDFLTNTANAAVQDILFDKTIEYKYVALFSRLNYKMLNRYIINATARRDGSSRFGDHNKFANFGALGAAWLFSEENFLIDSKLLTFGKLRGSYGVSGNDLIGDYQYLNTYTNSMYTYDGIQGLDPLRLYNPDFSWEKITKFEIALELELFNGKSALSIAHYRNKSSNQLVGIPLPSTTGFNSINGNLNAVVLNSGTEILWNLKLISKDTFRWNMGINVTVPKNKLLEFPNLDQSSYANQYVIGEPISVRKLFNYLGINKETGLYEFEDVNNDGVFNVDDRNVLVNISPVWYGGLTSNWSYRNISLDVLFQFVKQKTLSPETYTGLLGTQTNKLAENSNYYTPNSNNPTYQIPTAGNNFEAMMTNEYYKMSNAVVTDGSFVRLKSLQLTYDLSTLMNNKYNASLYFQGHNLLTWSKFQGHDPETIGGYMPLLRTLSFGLTFTF